MITKVAPSHGVIKSCFKFSAAMAQSLGLFTQSHLSWLPYLPVSLSCWRAQSTSSSLTTVDSTGGGLR